MIFSDFLQPLMSSLLKGPPQDLQNGMIVLLISGMIGMSGTTTTT